MPNNTYHSAFNKIAAAGQGICGTVLLPLKTKCKGPALPCQAKEDDIVDEAVRYWRANVLFKNFQSEGPADLQLAYCTIMIGEIIRECVKYKSKGDAQKGIQVLSLSTNFKLPGQDGFPLPGFFKPAAAKAEEDNFRGYFRQLREELAIRTIDVIYDAAGAKNKWWFQFSKRKFMNIDKT